MADKLLFAACPDDPGVRMAAYIKNDRLCEVHFSDEEERSAFGRIYIGKVVSVSKNLNAAFVDIGTGQNGYLPLAAYAYAVITKKCGKKPVCVGDELLVQVAKEAVKSKGPALTTTLTLAGTYVVVSTEPHGVKCSSKIWGEKRRALTEWVEEWQKSNGTATYGVVLRTNCAAAEAKESITEEYNRLTAQLTDMLERAAHLSCFSCVYAPDGGVLRTLNRLPYTAYEEIVTDSEEEYALLSKDAKAPVRLYADSLLPLAKLYSLPTQLTHALGKQVLLKSGASLVIEPTEALVSIDVNTGKCEKGSDREETFLRINLEAAQEIAGQLRLRRLSGIIVIDFISMKDAAHREELLTALRKYLADDPLRPTVVDMTRLGLVEVTRRKNENTLASYCRGKREGCKRGEMRK